MLDDIYVGLGGNLAHPVFGPPRRTLEQALLILAGRGIGIKAVSGWYESAPVPMSDQPWYVNAVASVATILDPVALLAVLNNTEAELGRVRTARDEPRLIDLDLLAYGPIVAESGPPPILPHPRMAGRAFVLLPIRDLDPNWRHPKTGKSINELIAEIPPNQITRRLEART